MHLASLLVRLGRYVATDQPRTRRIGLSATVGDVAVAQRYLSPDEPGRVTVIADSGESKEVQFRIHGYLRPQEKPESAGEKGSDKSAQDAKDEAALKVMGTIAADLVEHCRTHSNLVFANAKGDIEIYADLANEVCRGEGLPETFIVHHGSLAKEVREDTETTMKSGRAMTTVCSSTLEMGVDIGSVRLVGQIGAPWSVASFKQRLGRSGRKDGEPRRLRGYVISDAAPDPKDPVSAIPIDLLQTVAICELMLKKWVEPPSPARLDVSTLSHQVISTIAELGAVTAAELHTRLCVQGPFRGFTPALFVCVLRELGQVDVVEQGPDGKLILGLDGEFLRKQKDFYAAFASKSEYAIVAGDRTLGTLPIETVPKEGEHIVFAARRWQVVDVDAAKLVLHVVPAKRRQRPKFTGSGGDVHARIRDEMLPGHATDAAFELDDSRISKLWLQEHFTHTEVACFDRGWDRQPATDAARAIVGLLAAGLAKHVFGA
ncbi:MAG: helicase-related protein [Gammaproteobacteria bacterium]|nr:helicase-related protein [Gammaproteobacteria bacterium]